MLKKTKGEFKVTFECEFFEQNISRLKKIAYPTENITSITSSSIGFSGTSGGVRALWEEKSLFELVSIKHLEKLYKLSYIVWKM